jgi:cation diffusion facilitator CzcD-associated flavoprotein CzcO
MAKKPTVIIIGAGFSGIGLAIELKRAGLDQLIVLERGDGIGGCWRGNTYPGIACDVPSRLYCYSFAPYDWSRSFSAGDEIRGYLERCAHKYGVDRYVRTGQDVSVIRREGDKWIVETKAGERYFADVVVPALGPLSDPKMPEIEGLESFEGAMFHSARWNHDVDLKGKRVGVIGSAASAAQIVPEVAKVAGHLSVFLRTPNWVIPRDDFAYSPRQRALVRRFPFLLTLINRWLFARWEANHAYLRKNSRLGKALGKQMLRSMLAQVPKGPMRDVLIPDYAPGCKRIIMSSTYLPALQLPNVEPVTAPIKRITPAGVRTRDGKEHVFDVIALATGYKSFDISQSMDVIGPGDIHLKDVWRERSVTHRTVAVSGFPNLFIMMGPHTGLGHNTVTAMIEAQARYIARCVKLLWKKGASAMTPKRAPAEAFYDDVLNRLNGTVLNDGCNAWYKNGPGGKVQSIWPGTVRNYRKLLRKPAVDEFEIV